MSLYGALDKTKHFDEFNEPLDTGSGFVTPAARKAEALANLGVTADAAELNALDGMTATAAELNAVADISANTVVVAGTGGAVTVPTGGGNILIPLLTSNATVALPVPTKGLTYNFMWTGTAADAEDTIITSAATSFFVGGLTSLISGTADITPVYANGTTHNTLSVLNPDGGSWVTLVGISATQWAVIGNAVSVATAPTFTAV